MFRTIVVATDLSPASERVLDCVSSWRIIGLRKVVVAHVHNIVSSGGFEDALRQAHAPKLERQADRLRQAGISATWRLEFGVPYVDLDHLAHEEGAEAVIIGSHGRTWPKGVWLGSIAEAILHHSTLPVMIIKVNSLAAMPAGECALLCAALFDKVLYPTDFSDAAESAWGHVTRCIKAGRGAVHMVHVQEQSRIRPHLEHRLEQFNQIDSQRLERMAEILRESGAGNVTFEVRFDHPVRGILGCIGDWAPHLVVLGCQGRGRLLESLLGSTAHQVARLSPVPVLLVPWRR